MSTSYEIENLLVTALAELIVETAHPQVDLAEMPGILHRAAKRMQEAL